MIPTKKHELDVTSTLDGREIGMSIDENSLQHIMAVLTDLYSDPLLAIVREYSTNARDSHIAAGKDDVPIEVYTPTAIAPSLRIIDHGTGLSEDDIENIYSKYGASTKTDSNDFNGVLGLGCKSALTYSSQFTVVGVKDGVKTQVSVSRDEEGVGTMMVLDRTETTDDNGVEISIAIKSSDRNNIKDKAEEFFRYWKPGTVLLNGKQPEHVTGMPVGEHIIIEQNDDYYAKNILVMGGVAYPLENPNYSTDMDFKLPSGYRLIAEVPIGAVHFTPSREALNYTKRTKDVITQLVSTFQSDLIDSVTKEIEAQATMADAAQTAIKWINLLPKNLRDAKFTYKGIDLPARIEPPTAGDQWIISEGPEEKDWYGKRVRVGASSHISSVAIGQVAGCLFVTGFKRTFTPTCKHKLWRWCEVNEVDIPNHFIMTGEAPDSPWIRTEQIISWPDDVEPIKLPRYTNRAKPVAGASRLRGSYDLYENGVHRTGVPADDIDTSKPLYYYNDGKRQSRNYAHTLDRFVGEYTLVYFTQRREAKFLKNFPDAKPVFQALCEMAGAWFDMLSDHDKRLLKYHTESYAYLHTYQHIPLRVLDPDVQYILKLRDYNPDYVNHLEQQWNAVRGYLRYYNTGHTDELHTDKLPDLPTPLNKYPLVNNHRWYSPDATVRKHMLQYMNMIYQMEQSTNA